MKNLSFIFDNHIENVLNVTLNYSCFRNNLLNVFLEIEPTDNNIELIKELKKENENCICEVSYSTNITHCIWFDTFTLFLKVITDKNDISLPCEPKQNKDDVEIIALKTNQRINHVNI